MKLRITSNGRAKNGTKVVDVETGKTLTNVKAVRVDLAAASNAAGVNQNELVLVLLPNWTVHDSDSEFGIEWEIGTPDDDDWTEERRFSG